MSNNTKSSDTDENIIAKDLLSKCGILDNLQVIVDDIEEQLAGEYEAIDDEEDGAITPSYGGLCYTRYYAVNDGELEYRLGRRLSAEQAKLLKWFSDEGNLEISVCRSDGFRHEYSFTLYLPTAANSPAQDKLFANIEFTLSIFGANIEKFDAELAEGLDANAIGKSLMLCFLSS